MTYVGRSRDDARASPAPSRGTGTCPAAPYAASRHRPGDLVGAVTYYDAQVDDSRHTLEPVRTAAAHGASAVKVVGLTKQAGAVADREPRP